MIYKKPKTLFLELEEEDVVTLSIDGTTPDTGGDSEKPPWWEEGWT